MAYANGTVEDVRTLMGALDNCSKTLEKLFLGCSVTPESVNPAEEVEITEALSAVTAALAAFSGE